MRILKKILKTIFVTILILAAAAAAINIYVVASVKDHIGSPEQAAAWIAEEGAASCILVLGASVAGGEPSPILAHRLDAGLEIFSLGASDILLLSGDNGSVEYNEVQGMKNYILKNGGGCGAEDANIYLDYAGFSTYDSAYRCKNIFEGERVVVVTQRYHLYRALYIADKLGLDAYGVAAEDIKGGQFARDVREIPARVKDFFLSLAKGKPAILGEKVPLVYPSTQAAQAE
ncbi:MAG: YdcF family protein [Clostridiales Family XIII bacterium]|jgi:vancomycin permeability regulator SanA|nr:YdcF family protein [Clostridiales Family XIII bacterium]